MCISSCDCRWCFIITDITVSLSSIMRQMVAFEVFLQEDEFFSETDGDVSFRNKERLLCMKFPSDWCKYKHLSKNSCSLSADGLVTPSVKVRPHLYTNANEACGTKANANEYQKVACSASVPLIIRWLPEWMYVHISTIANLFFFEVPTPDG